MHSYDPTSGPEPGPAPSRVLNVRLPARIPAGSSLLLSGGTAGAIAFGNLPGGAAWQLVVLAIGGMACDVGLAVARRRRA
ncbi:MAG TPA: hypothetical protein VFH94_00730 [Streptomyces sp.]|nr:hypothetical protein [Streptomyces sp.]